MKINFKELNKKVNSKYKGYKKKFIFYIKDKDYLNKLGNKFEKDFKPKYQNFVHITIPSYKKKLQIS